MPADGIMSIPHHAPPKTIFDNVASDAQRSYLLLDISIFEPDRLRKEGGILNALNAVELALSDAGDLAATEWTISFLVYHNLLPFVLAGTVNAFPSLFCLGLTFHVASSECESQFVKSILLRPAFPDSPAAFASSAISAALASIDRYLKVSSLYTRLSPHLLDKYSRSITLAPTVLASLSKFTYLEEDEADKTEAKPEEAGEDEPVSPVVEKPSWVTFKQKKGKSQREVKQAQRAAAAAAATNAAQIRILDSFGLDAPRSQSEVDQMVKNVLEEQESILEVGLYLSRKVVRRS